jgi:transposase InsO family protein
LLRRQWLTELIREVHVASRGTCGYRRVHAELTMGMGITVCEPTVWLLMNNAGIYGSPGPTRVKRLRGVVTGDDLVNRIFHRWKTRIELVNAIFEYIKIFHNRRRHSARGYRTPIEYEPPSKNDTISTVS